MVRCLQESGEIVLSSEIKMTRLRLMEVPEDVGGHRVEAHGAGHLHCVPPAGARDASVVYLSRKNLKWMLVQLKFAVLQLKGMLRRCSLKRQDRAEEDRDE